VRFSAKALQGLNAIPKQQEPLWAIDESNFASWIPDRDALAATNRS
jgi:hypothetical protein